MTTVARLGGVAAADGATGVGLALAGEAVVPGVVLGVVLGSLTGEAARVGVLGARAAVAVRLGDGVGGPITRPSMVTPAVQASSVAHTAPKPPKM